MRRRIQGQRRTARPRPEAILIDTTPLKMPLGALGAIEIQLVRRTADEPLFESLMEEFHYLRYEQPVGEHLKYLVWAQGRPVACLAWSSAPRHLASRDRFIGWSGEARRRNIRYLAYNTRFLILPWVEVPHLASHILGRMARQISQDWERIYGHPIYFLETFIDPERFRGTCYRAANWVVLGRTTGRGKDDQTHRPNRSIKEVLGTSTPSAVSRVTAEYVSEYEARATRRHQRRVRGHIGRSTSAAGRSQLPEVTGCDPHSQLCNRVAGNSRGDAGEVAPAVVPLQHGEDGESVEAGRHRDWRARSTTPSEDTPRSVRLLGMGATAPRPIGAHAKSRFRTRSLKAGDPCPDGQCGGKVYPQRDPGVLVRIKGQAPIAATVYELEKLRCNLCGDVFTAAAPEGAGEQKYDETAASMIALLRYGSGFPWYRLEGLQENLGIPLPAATQCEIVKETAAQIQPAGDELIRQAAQGGVVHNDDTSMRVLSLDRGAASDVDIAAERTGVFTSGIVSIGEGISDRAVFHRAQACRREPGRRVEAAGGGLGRADPDVRRAVAQSAQGTGSHYRALHGACPPPLCGSHAELPAGVPVRIGESG